MKNSFIVLIGVIISAFCFSCSSEDEPGLKQSECENVGYEIYSAYSALANARQQEILASLNVGVNSRGEEVSLLAYLLSQSDEDLGKLSEQYPSSEEAFEARYDAAIDSLLQIYKFEDVTEFTAITNSYFEMGGRNIEYITSEVKVLPEGLKNIALATAASFDELTEGVPLMVSRHRGCAAVLAAEIGGVVFLGCLDASLGGAFGGAVGASFMIFNVSVSDAAAVIGAVARYKYCEKTGVYL